MTAAPADRGRDETGPPPDDASSDGGLRVSGIVHGSVGGVYRVVLPDERAVEASLRGRLRQQQRTGDRVVIGDRVQVAPSDGTWTIDTVEPRDSEMVRRGPGGRKPKVVAANVARVFIVVATREPEAHTELIDRLLAVAESGGLDATLVVNKVDLEGGREVADGLARLYGPIGYDVVPVSAASGEGMDRLAASLCQGVSALIGPSGAGKSTLLNHIDPSLDLRTGELSRKTGRGRHTTVSARLIPLACGGLVADTPGFSDVGVWGVDPGDVASCFPEIAVLEDACRFRGCGHVKEPDCAVREAVENGTVAASRYTSFLKLRGEAKETDPWD